MLHASHLPSREGWGKVRGRGKAGVRDETRCVLHGSMPPACHRHESQQVYTRQDQAVKA